MILWRQIGRIKRSTGRTSIAPPHGRKRQA